MTKDNLERLKDVDFHKEKEFVQLVVVLYTYTQCVMWEECQDINNAYPPEVAVAVHFEAGGYKYHDVNIQAF